MNKVNSEIYNKYTIDTISYSTGRFSVHILNNNAKKLYNATVCHYSFATLEKAQEYIVSFKSGVDKREQEKLEWKQKRMAERKEKGSITQVVKKALAEKYGYAYVSVNRGRGTAYGWVEASVKIEKPECSDHDLMKYSCECSKYSTKIREEAQGIAYKAVAEANMKFYTYYSDDGYGTDRDEFLLDVKFI